MPDGIAVCIHDFGVVHHAGHAIGVRNIFGGVEVIHRAVQRGIAVSLSAGKGCVVGGAAAHIPHGIKVNLGDADFAQGAVIFHNAVCGRNGIVVLIGGFAAVVGIVGAAGVLGGVVDGYSSFHTCTGDKFGTAFVSSGNVGIIVSVVQPDYRIVAVLGDFDIVTALAQRSVGDAGMIDVCPIAKIACGRFAFHDDKLARITLCVVEGVAHGIRGCISRTVDDRISAIALALHTVGVVTTGCKKLITYTVPLINFITGVGSNRVAGFAVVFSDIDLQAPFCVAHQVLVVGVCGYGQGLVAAVAAPILFKAIGYRDFFVSELQAAQLGFGAVDCCVHGILCFCLQFRNGGIAGAVGGFVGSLLRSIRSDTTVACAGGLSHRVVQAPACGCITAVLLVVVIGGVTAGGYGLFACRADRPAAAVNAAGLGDGFDLNGRAVHFFLRFQLNLICADSIGKIKTAAGGLGRCLPAGIVFLHNRFRLRFLLPNLRTDQGNGLPPCATGIVDVGVVAAGGGISFHAVQQLVSRGEINFCGSAFGEVFDDIHLYIVIN